MMVMRYAPRVAVLEIVLTQEHQIKETICDAANVDAKLCTEDQIGAFLLTKNATDVSQNTILSTAVHLNNPDAIKYAVRKTGFYCVSTYAYSGEDYGAVVTFRNSYGELPAAQIAKLPFYGGLTIVYAVIGWYELLERKPLAQLFETPAYIDAASGHSFTSKTVSTSVRQQLFVTLPGANSQQCRSKTTSRPSSSSWLLSS